MAISCIIIEDEPLAIEKLVGFISQTSLQLKGSFNNAIEGLKYIQNHNIDLVFLDIQMEMLTGIQMLESLNKRPYVIITSAYAEYALKGYELQVFDYLLKPFGFDRFLKAVSKVITDFNEKHQAKAEEHNQLFVKSEYRIENIPVKDILYIEGMKEYLRIVLPSKKIMTKDSFKNLLNKLPENQFIQVHKSWVINLHKFESVERNRIYIDDKIIPIGKTFQASFYEIIKAKQ